MVPSAISTSARPPPTPARCPSDHIAFSAGSWGRDGTSTGPRFTGRIPSAARVARLAERTEAKVANASTSVPPAVANDDTVTQLVTVRRIRRPCGPGHRPGPQTPAGRAAMARAGSRGATNLGTTRREPTATGGSGSGGSRTDTPIDAPRPAPHAATCPDPGRRHVETRTSPHYPTHRGGRRRRPRGGRDSPGRVDTRPRHPRRVTGPVDHGGLTSRCDHDHGDDGAADDHDNGGADDDGAG